jgi:hypothetical protein
MFSRFHTTFSIVFFVLCFGWSLPGIAQTLSVSSSISALTIHPGDSGITIPVTLGGTGTGTNPVSITLTGLPSGISVSPLSLAPGTSGVLQLAASVAADQEAFPHYDPTNPDTATSTISVVATQGTTSATFPLSLTVSLHNPSFLPSPQGINLPIVSINTGGTAIVSKAINVPGTITITSADGSTTYLPGIAGTDNTATFHVHGNTTALMPKLPYSVSLNTSTDLLSGMGLSCGYVKSGGVAMCDKSKSYVLLANYDDKTLLRDWSASALANSITFGGAYLNSPANSPTPSGTSTLMWWAPHSLFVELYLNGAYQGTYQLIEQVKVDSHRVNINEMAKTDISGKALTGGYFLEIDQRQAEDFTFITPHGVYFGLEDPDFTPEVPEQTTYIQNYVNAAEAALFSPNYTDPTLGWRAYFDDASLVNYYLVNDLMGNLDAGRFFSSIYLYKDKNNPLLYMGPVWDFDLSAGTALSQAITEPTVPWMQTQNPWYPRLFSDPSFLADVRSQFNAMKSNGVLSNWITSIAQQGSALETAQKNNFSRWPMLGILVWPDTEAVGTYDGEVEFLTTWLRRRMGYLDTVLNTKTTTTTALTATPTVLVAGTSATLTATISGSHPSGSVSFSANTVPLGTAPINASGVATLTTTNLPAGLLYVSAYYDGDTTNGGSGIGIILNNIAPVASMTHLTASTTSLNAGDPITLTASMVLGTSVLPTGTVTFYSNGASIGSATLNSNGTASITVTNLTVGADSVTAGYNGDSIYSTSTSNALSVTVNGIDPQLAFTTIGAHTFGDAAFAVSATSNSTGALTYSVTSGPATVAGNIVTLAGAGPVTLTVAQAAQGNYAASTATATFSVAKATPTLAFAAIATHAFNDAPFTVSATSASSGTVTYSVISGQATLSGNTVTITGLGVVVLGASQAAQGNYDVASAQTSFLVIKAIPVMNFAPVGPHTYGDAPFAVSATSTSTATITYSVVSGPATIAGNMVTVTGAGTVVLQADQSVHGNYDIATTQTSFMVAKATPVLSFGTLAAHTFGDAPFAVSATSTSPASITYSVVSGPATIAGSTMTLTGAGTVVLQADQPTQDNYIAASARGSFTIAKATPALTFGTLAAHTFGDAPFAISATSTSPATITYSVVSGPATVAGSIVTLTGAGTVLLQADQATQYNAGSAQMSFTVAKATPAISFASIAGHAFGDAPFTVSATSTSSAAIAYRVISGPATISGSTVSLTGAGAVVLAATQEATDNYALGSTNTSVPVARAAIAVTLSANSTSIVPGQAVILTATPAATGISLPASGTVSFLVDGAALGQPVSMSSGVAVLSTTALLSGARSVTAVYSGDQNFLASTSGSVVVTVAPLDFTLTAGSSVSQTVSAGTSVSFNAQLAPLYQAYPGTVSFSLTGLPAGATYTVSPATVDAGAGAVPVVVTLRTSTATARRTSNSKVVYLGFLVLALPLAGMRQRRTRGLMLVTLLALLGGTAALSGCGDKATVAQTFPLTLNATSGSVQHSVSFTVTVQ